MQLANVAYDMEVVKRYPIADSLDQLPFEMETHARVNAAENSG